MKTHALRLSVSTLALGITLGWFSTAIAADNPPPASKDKDNATVETIVITAERRNESLEKTAVSATVLTGSDLANKGVVTVEQIQFASPAATVNNFGQGIDFNIRGIGKAEHNSQTLTGVITYRDGVASFPGYFQLEPYYDIAGVEIYRGPQGTMVGQNATGGAVFVNTMNPIINGGHSGYAQAQVGNYGDFGVQGSVNIPISDTLAARVAVLGERRDSFYTVTGGSNNPSSKIAAMRFGLLWQPTENLSVLWKTDADYLDMGAYMADPYSDRYKQIRDPNTVGHPLITNPNYTDLFHVSSNCIKNPNFTTGIGFGGSAAMSCKNIALDRFVRSSLKVDYALSNGIVLRSVSGFQKGTTAYQSDLDGIAPTGNNGLQNPNANEYLNPNLPFGNFGTAGPPLGYKSCPACNYYYTFGDQTQETIWSQEFNIVSPDDGMITYVLGALAQSDSYDWPGKKFFIGLPQYAGPYTLTAKNPKRTLAAFGQATLHLPMGFSIVAGARYSDYRSANHGSQSWYGYYNYPLEQLYKDKNFSYKLSLSWQANDTNFLYGYVSTGFKSGGLNPAGPYLGANPAPFKSEHVTDYEMGWKSTFFDGHMRTSVDTYFANYKDFVLATGVPNNPLVAIQLNNPNPTTMYGIEGELDAVFGAFTFGGGIALMHSAQGHFFAFDTRTGGTATTCNPLTGPVGNGCVDLTGHTQSYAPNFSYNFDAAYEFTIDAQDRLTPRVTFGHVSAQWATLFENASIGDRLSERNILGAQLAWRHDDIIVTLFASNLANQHYVAALNSGLDFAGAPRQYGIKLFKAF